MEDITQIFADVINRFDVDAKPWVYDLRNVNKNWMKILTVQLFDLYTPLLAGQKVKESTYIIKAYDGKPLHNFVILQMLQIHKRFAIFYCYLSHYNLRDVMDNIFKKYVPLFVDEVCKLTVAKLLKPVITYPNYVVKYVQSPVLTDAEVLWCVANLCEYQQ